MEREAPAHVLATPVWVVAVRVLQALVALIVLALAADIAHDLYLDELGLAIAVVSGARARGRAASRG